MITIKTNIKNLCFSMYFHSAFNIATPASNKMYYTVNKVNTHLCRNNIMNRNKYLQQRIGI